MINNEKPKTKVVSNKEGLPDEQLAKGILKKQSKILEEEIGSIKEMKHGRSTKVFKLREKCRALKSKAKKPVQFGILHPKN